MSASSTLLHSTEGQSLVEFAIFLPFFIVILFLGVELGAFYMEKQKVLALSRELASTIHRDCARESDIEGCVDFETQQIFNAGIAVIGPAFASRGSVIGTFYQYQGAGLPPLVHSEHIQPGGTPYVCPGGVTPCVSGATIYDSSSTPQMGKIALSEAFLQSQGYVATAEVSFHHVGVSPIYVLLGAVLPESVHESTIF